MKLYKLLAIIALMISICTSAVLGETSGNINLFLGAKSLESGDWSPAEEQSEVGVKFDIGEKGKTVKFAFDILSSSTTDSSLGIDVTGSTLEMNIGVRSYSDPTGTGAFFGVGLSFIDAEIEILGLGSASTDAIGLWLELGAQMRVGTNVNLGIDLIFSTAIDDDDIELGGTHFGFFVGVSF